MSQERKGCAALLLEIFRGSPSSNQPRHHESEPLDDVFKPLEAHGVQREHVYRMRDDFVSQAEVSFFHVLRRVIEDRALISAKVRLADVIYAPWQEEQRSAWNKISRKHLDFVVCDPRTLVPVLAIELDDRSHQRQNRRERDSFLDDTLSQAGLPLLRITTRRSYDPQVLAQLVRSKAPQLMAGQTSTGAQSAEQGATPRPPTEPTAFETAQARPCERCGGIMRLRVARQGPHTGERFWGCENYPQCRNVAPVHT